MDLALAYVKGCWETLCQISPALLGGFLAAGIISAFLSEDFIRRHLGGGGFMGTLKAALLGVPMPLCSCGVLPVAASLKRSGASRGAVVAFLISVPQTGADNILVVWSLLGPLFAIYSPLSAFLSGLFGGMVCEYLGGGSKEPLEAAKASEGEGATPKRGLGAILEYSFVTLVDDIAGALLAGICVAGLVSVAIPDGWIAAHLGPGIGSMLLMLLVGIPLYVCSSGSVPIAAAFIEKGASAGAALVFLITGPVSNAAGIAAIGKMLGVRTAVLYVASILVFAFGSGLLLNELYALMPSLAASSASHVHAHGAEALGLFNVASAITMLSLIATSMLKKLFKQTAMPEAGEGKGAAMKVKVRGMSCNHCVRSVEKALSGMPGVSSVQVDLKNGEASLFSSEPSSLPSFGKVKLAIEELGFECDRAE